MQISGALLVALTNPWWYAAFSTMDKSMRVFFGCLALIPAFFVSTSFAYAATCYYPGPDGKLIPYPCSKTLVIRQGDLFSIKIEQASPLFLGSISQYLMPGAALIAKQTKDGLQVDLTGLAAPAATDALIAVTPKTNPEEAVKFFSNENRPNARSQASEFLMKSPSNKPIALPLQ